MNPLIETAGCGRQVTGKPRREAGGRFERHLAGALDIARSPLAVVFGEAHLRCRTSDVDCSLFVVVIDLEVVVHLYMHSHPSRLDYSPFAGRIDRRVLHPYMYFHAFRFDCNPLAAMTVEGSHPDTRFPRLDRRPLVAVFVPEGVELRIPHASHLDHIRGYSSTPRARSLWRVYLRRPLLCRRFLQQLVLQSCLLQV